VKTSLPGAFAFQQRVVIDAGHLARYVRDGNYDTIPLYGGELLTALFSAHSFPLFSVHTTGRISTIAMFWWCSSLC
jgi:hypothetical protein